MAEIGIKELKTTASTVIEHVEAGAAYVVTKRGTGFDVLNHGRGGRLEFLDPNLSHSLQIPCDSDYPSDYLST